MDAGQIRLERQRFVVLVLGGAVLLLRLITLPQKLVRARLPA